MPRLDVRCDAQIPIKVLSTGSSQNVSQIAETKNLGLYGAFINSPLQLHEDTPIKLQGHLPSLGDFEIKGKILRKDKNGVAVRFVHLDKPSKLSLWEYIKDNITSEKECLYCGDTNINSNTCGECGMSIDFKSENFLEIHESEEQKKLTHYVGEATASLVEGLENLAKNVYLGNLGHENTLASMNQTMDNFIETVTRFENRIPDESFFRNLKTGFHQKTHHLFSKSYMFNRARTWPQGYQGDYKTLETIYRNIPLSEGLGYYLDLLCLNAPLALAVRNRFKMAQDLLKDEIEERQSPDILNIACGSCRELVEIVPEIINAKAQITCVDNDEDALAFAQNRFYYTEALRYLNFRKYNAIRLFDFDMGEKDFGYQDIIYSVGFFDYLESDFLVKFFRSLYALLKPGGKLIASFKDARQYRHQDYHWFVDWDGFLQRTEEDFWSIFLDAQIPQSMIYEMREDTGTIVFFVISK